MIRSFFKSFSGDKIAAVVTAAFLMTFLLLAVAGCEKKQHQIPPPDVVVAQVGVGDVPLIKEWVGTTDGIINAKINARVRGFLKTRNYVEGSNVDENQLMYTLDDRDYKAALDQAKANLDVAIANQAKSQLNVDKYAPLVKEGAVSQQEFDNAVQENIANKASIEAARAAVDTANINLGYTKITSPVTGPAGLSVVQIGDLVESNTVMTTVSQIDPIKVVFPISENEYLWFHKWNLERLKKGLVTQEQLKKEDLDMLDLILSDGSTYPYKGSIRVADRQIDIGTGTITLNAYFSNPDKLLRPGQYAKVRAHVYTIKNAITVPVKAIFQIQGVPMVVAVGPDNKTEFRTIKTGIMTPDNQNQIVESGLKAGDRIIVEGVMKVRPGLVVHPMSAEQADAKEAIMMDAGNKPHPEK